MSGKGRACSGRASSATGSNAFVATLRAKDRSNSQTIPIVNQIALYAKRR
jgi:hypothetical protein